MDIISTTVARRAALAIFFSAAAVTGVFAQNQRNIRFAALDANGDGVITRREWNGSDQSFRTHDWNGDGILSGEEVRPGGRRADTSPDTSRNTADRSFDDWTAEGFIGLDRNRDNRISRDEWDSDVETFRRADQNRDGVVTRSEFLGENGAAPVRGDRFDALDTNNDDRVSRAEWRGTAERFDRLDDNRDGVLTRAEIRDTNEPPPDLFSSADVNRDRRVTRDEWRWARAAFDERDSNRDGVLTPDEFGGESVARSQAWTQGRDRGLNEGRQAGKEDKQLRNAWDLEGQRELEAADSGYEARFGSKPDYQAGYREGFRRGYREGFGPR